MSWNELRFLEKLSREAKLFQKNFYARLDYPGLRRCNLERFDSGPDNTITVR